MTPIPEQHSKREEIIKIFQEMIPALAAVQDTSTGLWYQVLDSKPVVTNDYKGVGAFILTSAEMETLMA